MLNFVVRKLLSKKWMAISLLIGNLLLIAIATASPMYSQAVLQRTLTRNLNSYMAEKEVYPGNVQAKIYYSTTEDGTDKFQQIDKASQLMGQLTEELGVEALETVTRYTKNRVRARYTTLAEGRADELLLNLTAYPDVADHIEIIHGKMYSGELQDHTFDVIVSEKTLVTQNLILGEELELFKMIDDAKQSYRVRIAGVFKMKDDQDLYWVDSPDNWQDVCLMDMELFRQLIANPQEGNQSFNVEWRSVLDYTDIQADKASQTLQLLRRYEQCLSQYGVESLSANFQTTLIAFVSQAQKVNTTLWVLQMPIFALLAAFIFMVSRQMLEMEQNEISVFKSRGASKLQIIWIYLLQSILIALLGTVIGVPVGLLICKIIGSSNAFLEFVQRTALPVELGAQTWIFVGIAVLFSIGTMVLPVFRYAKMGIVETKRQRSRKLKQPWWQLIFLDVILLGVAIYGLYQFKGQEDYLAQKVMDGAGLDPLLFICSSLFMIGAGLLCVRIFPWLIKLVFWIGKRWWPSPVYASFLRILRTKDNQGFIIVFLIMTVAMGIFSAQTARTINDNAEQQLRYTVGADVVLQEAWASDKVGGLTTYYEPDSERYMVMDGVKKATKVQVSTNISVSQNNSVLKNVTLMGIHTKEFGEVAWFKDSLMDIHWYEYLNAMAQNSRAILLSSNFRDVYGYEVGDVLIYTNADGFSIRGIIYGFVDYWPSFSPVSNVKDNSGKYQQVNNYLIVANLAQIQSSWGVMPYEIWIDVEDSTQFLYDYAEESDTRYTKFVDVSAELITLKNDPVFQGTNGILTVGFVVVLLLCTTGFLIYWILSIHSRTLQFGIFRAMGMSMREILSMLVTEQLFISGMSIGIGVLVGKLCSSLYIPLIQIAYSAADRAIPLEIISDPSDDLRLGIVIGLMIVLCMIILGVLISRIRISQALKLGED